MFTGLIETIGQVKSINSHHGDIQAILSVDKDFASTIKEGDSLSINGVCLTAYNINKDSFSVDIMQDLKNAKLRMKDDKIFKIYK